MSKKQKKPTFVVVDEDGEKRSLYVNGTHVGDATHDELGWQGMEEVEHIFKRIAAVFGAEVEEGEADE